MDSLFPNAAILRTTIKVPLGPLGVWHMSPFRLIWRSTYVVFTTILAALLPFFNDIVGTCSTCKPAIPFSALGSPEQRTLAHSTQRSDPSKLIRLCSMQNLNLGGPTAWA